MQLQREVKVAARPELNEADALAPRRLIAHFDKGDNAPRHQAGNEAQADFFPGDLGGVKTDQDILIKLGGIGSSALMNLPGV